VTLGPANRVPLGTQGGLGPVVVVASAAASWKGAPLGFGVFLGSGLSGLEEYAELKTIAL
jgi:hypothetical protein